MRPTCGRCGRTTSRAGTTAGKGRYTCTSSECPDAFKVWYIRESTKEESMDGAALIAEERLRQLAEEGVSAEHDDEVHGSGDLATAAACYALPDLAPSRWPWDWRFWKPVPEDRVRELVKAGALIAAEIDRLARESERREA